MGENVNKILVYLTVVPDMSLSFSEQRYDPAVQPSAYLTATPPLPAPTSYPATSL